MHSLYPDSYEASRARFLRDVDLLRPKWPSSRLESHPLKNHPDLSIDCFWTEPQVKEKLVLISTGQHGIEGYVGSAMLKLFMDEFAPRIDPKNTGVLLVHAVNPWGMKYNRKVNENGVDLNRNFTYDGVFNPAINPDFVKLRHLLAPGCPVRTFAMETLSFAWRTIRALITEGASALTYAALLGQYAEPTAMYYGGTRHEEGSLRMMNLFRQALESYQTIIHLDMHSGYGPRYLMSITVVPLEPLNSAELAAKFNYPLVLRGDHEEFYATHGDMTEHFYKLRNEKFPDKHAFSCAFEFGTYGASLLARIRSLRTMIFESQLHWRGGRDKQTEAKIRHEFAELYFPAEGKWRAKALADCRLAYEGILTAHHAL
ncbi:MAG TPA: M14 family metallopeptidase [Anaerolineales bacterium]|nr:M14 family metallopeptidase [Anaerolineales bacterium]